MRPSHQLVPATTATRLVGAIGGGYVLLGLVWAGLVTRGGGPAADVLATGILIAGPGVLVAYGASRLSRTGLDPATYPRIAGRTLAGIAVLLAVVALMALNPASDVDRLPRAVSVATAVGAVGGLAVGTYEARARTRIREVTRRNRELRRYETLVEEAADVNAVLDPDGTFLYLTPSSEYVLGYEPEELVGEPAEDYIHPDDAEAALSGLGEAIEAGRSGPVEFRFRHADGSWVVLEGRGRNLLDDADIGGVVAYTHDVTERKRLEADLRRERDLRERIVETSPIGIAVLDRERTVTYANDRAERLFGRSRAELNAADHPADAVQPTDQAGDPIPESDLPTERVLATGEPVYGVEMRLNRPDGQPVWIAVNGAPIVDEAGEIERVALTIEDVTERRRHGDRLVALNDVSRDLMEAETAGAVRGRVVEAAASALPLSLVAVERFDGDRGGLTAGARSEAVADLVGDGDPFADGLGLAWQVYVDQEGLVSRDLREEPELSAEETPLRSAIVLPMGEHGVLVAGSTSPDVFDEADVSVAEVLAADARSALDRVERESILRDRTATLEEHNAALERLRRVNETIRGITTDLIRASTREQALQAVCDRLVTADAYRFAWVGRHDGVADEVVPEARAGVEEGYLSSVDSGVGDGTGEPVVGAVRTGETRVADAISADPPFDPWQRAAIDRGYRAAIAFPVVYGETVYGVVGVYADRPGVFDEMEAAVLTELGETVGYALNALERKRALVGETAVELEFELRGGRPPPFRFAAEHGCDFAFERVVRRADGRPAVFFTVRGADPAAVAAFAERTAEIEDVRVVADRDGETLFEATLRESAFLLALLDRGAVARTLRASGDEGRAIVRVPATSDLRQYVELFESQFEDVDLVGRREVDEPIRTPQEFEAEFRSRLTDRQAEVLETAFASGYFEWPRESSAQDVAESLGLSQPTVSRHLRAGERALFGLLFADR